MEEGKETEGGKEGGREEKREGEYGGDKQGGLHKEGFKFVQKEKLHVIMSRIPSHGHQASVASASA